MSGKTVPLPPVLLGSLGNDPQKNTVCLYGHLDVQPAHISDGWDSEPFVLTEKNSKLFGRGSTDDKGPVLGWFHAIEAFQNTGIDLPVNLKVCYTKYTVCAVVKFQILSFSSTFLIFKCLRLVCF